MISDFYAGKRVFLTGHTGFKGAWLVLWLKAMGAEVGAFSLAPPSTPSLWGLADIEQDVFRLGGDIRHREKLVSAYNEFKPDVAIHMAAQSLVRPSYTDPAETFDTNVMGTVNFLEAVRATPETKAAIVVTSDKCYENCEKGRGFVEDDPMGGHDPYSSSKGCAELVTQSYIKSFFNESPTSVASVRAGNVIGGGDFAADRLIPDMVRAFSAGESVHIRSPYAIRPWQHVLEPLSGYLQLLKKLYNKGPQYSGGWNFGPSDESAQDVATVVKRFSNAWGAGANHVIDYGDHPHEANWLKLDCSKANSHLQWSPKTDFTDAINMTASWYKRWTNGEEARMLTIEQIKSFEDKQ